MYFDYKEVLEPLQDKTAQLLLKGDVKDFTLHKWIRREATERYLNGSTKPYSDRTLEIIIARTDKNELDDFVDILAE